MIDNKFMLGSSCPKVRLFAFFSATPVCFDHCLDGTDYRHG